jgi:hypothetical protein
MRVQRAEIAGISGRSAGGGTVLGINPRIMKTAASWMRGGIVGLILVAPATGEPAERVTRNVLVDSLAIETELPPVDAIPLPALPVDPFPGRTYGDMDDFGCVLALEARGVAYERVGHARGVQTPVRLMGPLHGVRFRHADTPDWLESAKREILDCRLVLALDDLASVVAARGFTTVLHYGVYRGDLPLPKRGPVLHHVAALAMDVAAFEKEDGTRVDVRRDWRSRVGAPVCDAGPHASDAPTAEVHGIVCEVASERLFHQVLTPSHDARHKDHVHLEVMRGTEWSMVE